MSQHRRSCPVQWLKQRGIYMSSGFSQRCCLKREAYACVASLFCRALFPFYGLKNETDTLVVRAYRTSYFATRPLVTLVD